MVTYIRSDLDFILDQIEIAEAHAAGQPLFGPGGLVPAYNVSWGLRTVDGTYNNLLHPEWGAADNEFPEPLGTQFRTIMVDPDGPGPAPMVPVSYTPGVDNTPDMPDGPGNSGPSDVFDPYVRTISNLIVDQTLGNPSAILTALQRAGIVDPADQMTATANISAAYEPLQPLFNALAQAERENAAAQAAASASPNNQALQDAAAATLAAVVVAQAALEAADDGLMALLEAGGVELEGANIVITNSAPDEGLSAPFNSWFTLFGQFFDHGLDLVAKGGNGTVFIPLMPDDPLYVPGGTTNFMVLTRATLAGPGADGILGDDPATVGINEGADDTDRPVNTTTSFVDQNQTYTSHASHQVFLREYELNAAGEPVATGRLIEGSNGGMATWADLKAQARDMLGIDLTDFHVGNLPLLATDEYGNFIPDPVTGFPQVVMIGPPQTLASGTPEAPLSLVNVLVDGPDADVLPDVVHLAARTGHAFLADIAHNAVPTGLADGDITIGLGNPENGPAEDGAYDNELLDAHFVAGDGRANENIGLTAVHHVFHSEHNRLVEHTKAVVLQDAAAMLAGGATQAEAVAFLNEWLVDDVAAVPVGAAIDDLVWDGERLFQAAKFGTEMQYQHLVFEEFARKIQPNINVFLVPDGFDVTIDPSIVAEFAHVVYRFGHSMLTESIDRFDPNFTEDHIGLIEGFLNPIQFLNNGTNDVVNADIAAGAIIRGMTRQVGNEIDEFVTSALRNNLLGLPLDLATINLARGRDTGVPTLNEARRQFFEATNQDVLLKPYESWVDFAGHLKHEASIINFIAAYGTHSLITGQTTIEGKRDAALTIITGISVGGLEVPVDASDFLNATGAYASTVLGSTLGGLNDVDLWIGGLAEAIMPFGGMLGSTFNFVFEMQMEKLQNGDRFYYLQRLDGLHLFGEMENNSFASLIMRNTDATHLPSDVFSTPGLILEVDQTRQFNDLDGDGTLESTDPAGGGILTPLVVRNNPATVGTDANYLRYTGGDHVVLGGTNPGNAANPSGNDILIAGIGDDTLFGDGGNDRLEGGFGNDIINGGAGDDIIVDSGGDDNIKGEDGNDVVHAGPGLDLVMGGRGQDFIFLGTDMGSEVFAGEGNDFIYGNKNAERILGNEGNDWIETGTFDGAPGDNFDEIFAQDGIDGHDVFLGDGGFDEFIAEGGDDIMVGSPGRGKLVGMSGWDWATYKDDAGPVDADLSRAIVFDENPTPPVNAALDAYESVEGLSGSRFSDKLTGSNTLAEERLPFAQGGSEGYKGSRLTKEGIARIAGLQQVLGLTDAQFAALAASAVAYSEGDIILGGDGSDTIKGLAGDDIIDGDKWLNVRIAVHAEVGPDGGIGAIQEYHNSMTTLASKMFAGLINPGQLQIVRSIETDLTTGDIDTAVFQGNRGEYAFSATSDGQVIVSHAIEDSLDGTDRLRNIEKIQFLDGGALNIIVGTSGNDTLDGTADDDLILGLDGADILNGGAGNDILVGGASGPSGAYADNFNTASYANNTVPPATANFAGSWGESGDVTTGNIVTGGQIRITGGDLVFRDDDNDTGNGGAQIQRTLNLAGATTATISYDYDENSFDAGEIVQVQFAANGTTFITLQTLNNNSGTNSFSTQLTGPFTANAVLRFVVSNTNNNSGGGDNIAIDNLSITFSGADVLNGGLGDDTYSFGLGDGNDIINESVSATSGGSADRISILSTTIDPGTLLPVLSALNANDSNTGTSAGDLVINYTLPTGTAQQITVGGHFTGANAQTGVERINFNGATFAGYLLGSEDYLISRADPANRDNGGVNLSASIANNFLVGEQGVNDEIIGGSGNDLIFGGTGDNQLSGGAGDDLLVGGSGTGDNDILDGGLDADTMIGLAGNDTYIVDDLADVVVEAAGEGTDTVETEMAELSIELMANVENLEYTGIDADPFVGTGNSGNNIISGGDLNDTLSGLAGNDTLNGGLGADNMIGGAGNDTYIVDDVGDVVDESTGLLADVDTVESSVDYTLAAGIENLELDGDAVVGRGNIGNNVISGNGAANQLSGLGGNDTLNGDDGNDFLDGGDGNDTLNGGDDTDTIIGGAGNDIIDVGGGVNTIVYNATGFGNDTITSFDAAGGTPANQDRIDLSGLGITSTNFGTRVTIQDIVDAGTDDTLVTVRDAGGVVIGTIFIDEVDGADITQTDFTLAAASTVFPGATTGNNTLNGTAGNDIINALAGNDTVNGNAGNDTISGGLNGTGGPGADVLNGNAGDDTFIWNANTATATSLTNSDGRDQINGGTEGGPGDTFIINGNGANEAYSIYTLAAWDAVAGNALGSFNGRTPEIVITRGGSSFGNVIAELTEIEEIRINGVDPSGTDGAAGLGDTFAIIGDFSNTSLRLNTITIEGSDADDTIDISGLSSSHRVVFNSNGGNDTIVGTPRPQDVIEGDVTVTPGDGDVSNAINGTNGNDRLDGTREADALNGKAGNDRLSGGRGDDALNGGAGNDILEGGRDDDTFVFTVGFGDDRIKDFDANANGGQDLLDISDLGITSANFAASVAIFDVGRDTLVVIGDDSILLEGVNGSGNNAITQNDFLLG
jgi:Ca2+-binding RTX toxin-like protein